MRGCELCKYMAKMYCESDQASLCWDCDSKVHSANFLVARHTRCLLCHVCQSPTPWKASGEKLFPTVSVCEKCVKAKRQGVNDITDEEVEDETEGNDEFDMDDVDDENYDEDENENQEEEEDEDNQVVPWSLTPPPTGSSSSSSEEFSSVSDPRSVENFSPPSISSAQVGGAGAGMIFDHMRTASRRSAYQETGGGSGRDILTGKVASEEALLGIYNGNREIKAVDLASTSTPSRPI
ncbi:B-box-type zinc finger [Dillenia turbinata]|uniref:B-box-type zinc finger n=1 Tax=Dillenia turbinata TaxID=194707 RepID=A0AAN8YY49_9MAGN